MNDARRLSAHDVQVGGDDAQDALLQLLAVDDLLALAGRQQGRLVHEVGQVGTAHAGCCLGHGVEVDIGADALVAAYSNVTRVNGLLDSMTFAEPLDMIFMSQEYHDFHIPGFNTDVARMNAAVFAALKNFQADQGLRTTGTAKPGDETVAALNNETANAAAGETYIWRTAN